MRPGRRAALLIAIALTGCARLRVGTDGLSYADRRDRLEAIDTWEMRGRLAVDTGDGGFQGSFNWQQQDDALDLLVRGPLRNGVLHVDGRPEELTFTARGETHTLTDPEVQLSELIGWWLPVASLPHWLLGLPDPGFNAVTETGTDGTLASLEQRLWRAEYPAYGLASIDGPSATAVLVPRRIELTHGALTLTLTIDDWKPTAAAAAP
jgi:outer membrane lipoprotein LolB